jgi:hypothetical protein
VECQLACQESKCCFTQPRPSFPAISIIHSIIKPKPVRRLQLRLLPWMILQDERAIHLPWMLLLNEQYIGSTIAGSNHDAVHANREPPTRHPVVASWSKRGARPPGTLPTNHIFAKASFRSSGSLVMYQASMPWSLVALFVCVSLNTGCCKVENRIHIQVVELPKLFGIKSPGAEGGDAADAPPASDD